MPDHSHDTAGDGFHEIQLSGKQLVFLAMTASAIFIFIFICGVLVGKNMREGRSVDSVEAATPPPGAPASLAEAGQPGEPPTPAETADELSYHKRLQGEGTPAEELKKPAEPAPAPAPAPQAAAPVPATPADVSTTARAGTLVVQVFASQDSTVAAALVRRLAGKGYPAFLVPPAGSSGPQMYRVQVGGFNDRRDAEAAKRRLEKEEQFKPWILSR